jgi:hypothetical protein
MRSAREIVSYRFYRNHGNVGDGKGYSTKLSIKLLLEPRDLWIGVYWTRGGNDHLFVYLCILPMLPVRFHWARSWGGRFE